MILDFNANRRLALTTLIALLFMSIYSKAFALEFNFNDVKNKKIEVSSDTNVLLIFGDEIKQAITGHSNYQFVYNSESGATYGIIRAIKGIERSNIHIVTANGNIYAFTLIYKETVDDFSHTFSYEDAIGNIDGDIVSDLQSIDLGDLDNAAKRYDSENPPPQTYNLDISKEIKIPETGPYYDNRSEYLTRHARFVNSRNESVFKRIVSTDGDVYLYLEDIDYNRNELYFKFKIDNRSAVDYKLNFVKFFIERKRKRKKATSQVLEKEYLVSYELPSEVMHKSDLTFVVAFDKFGLDDKNNFIIELNESNGARNIKLSLDDSLVNNPN